MHWHGTWPRPTVGENTSSWSGYIVDFADGDVLVLDSGTTSSSHLLRYGSMSHYQ